MNLIKRITTPPVFQGEADKTIVAASLHVLLLAAMVVATCAFILFAVIAPESLPRVLATDLPIVLVLLASWILVRRGQVRFAAVMAVGIAWVGSTLSSVMAGGVKSSLFGVGSMLVVLVSGFLLGPWGLVGIIVLNILTGITLVWADTQGWIPPVPASVSPVSILISYALNMVAAAVAMYVAIHSLRSALDHARQELIERKSAEAKFRTIIEQSSEAIVLTDECANIIEWNRACEKLTGIPRDQAVQMMLWDAQYRLLAPDHQTPEHLAEIKTAILTAIETGKSSIFNQPIEATIRTQEGVERRVLQNAFAVSTENGFRIASLVRDITDRKLAEEALRASEDKFSKAFHTSPDSVNINRLSDGMFIEINQGFTRLTGYTIEEVRGKTSREINIWADPNDRARLVQGLQEHGIVENLEAKFQSKNGQTKTALMSARIVQVGGELCILSITRDISERKQAEQERESLIRELEAKNAELERFTYTVSHDLKSPLITIRGFLGFLTQDIQTGDMARLTSDMTRIVNATNKMQQLLNDLLELSRIGRMMNPPEDVPFDAIVRDAIELVRGQLTDKNIRLIVAEHLPTVRGDRVRLFEVMQNLIDNAAKFMGNQTQPTIDIGVQGTDADGKPIFFVRDNGIGIDAKYRERVFGLFNKLDTETEGTGVGLALVKRIVEVHGGSIWVESQLGQGSTFYFTLAHRT